MNVPAGRIAVNRAVDSCDLYRSQSDVREDESGGHDTKNGH